MSGQHNKIELLDQVDRIVLCIDIRSSSRIIEDLTTTNHVDELLRFLGDMKNWVRRHAERYSYVPYKFIGDGWLLLFLPSIEPKAFYGFLNELARWYDTKMSERIEPLLQVPLPISGLTFGAELGRLLETRMIRRTEYIGRAINVACRLQKAAKDYGPQSGAAYSVGMSRHLLTRFRTKWEDFPGDEKPVPLHNMVGAQEYIGTFFTLQAPEHA